jgi:hypothetical protein
MRGADIYLGYKDYYKGSRYRRAKGVPPLANWRKRGVTTLVFEASAEMVEKQPRRSQVQWECGLIPVDFF